MIANLTKQKIRSEHLDRLAMIYVRQSTLAQVRNRTASAARQYDLAERAGDLGWPVDRIVVIDEDQGKSGASAANRDGFQRLVAEVGLGNVGAVFSIEVSRLVVAGGLGPCLPVVGARPGCVSAAPRGLGVVSTQ